MLQWVSALGLSWKIFAVGVVIGFSVGNYTGWKAHGVFASIEANAIINLAGKRLEELKKSNDELQKKYSTVRDYRESKRVRDKCLYSAGTSLSTTPTIEHAGKDGAITGSTEDFRDYAATCESLRQERIVLESAMVRAAE